MKIHMMRCIIYSKRRAKGSKTERRRKSERERERKEGKARREEGKEGRRDKMPGTNAKSHLEKMSGGREAMDEGQRRGARVQTQKSNVRIFFLRIRIEKLQREDPASGDSSKTEKTTARLLDEREREKARNTIRRCNHEEKRGRVGEGRRQVERLELGTRNGGGLFEQLQLHYSRRRVKGERERLRENKRIERFVAVIALRACLCRSGSADLTRSPSALELRGRQARGSQRGRSEEANGRQEAT